MNNLKWIEEIQWQDKSLPAESIENEEMYTLYISDFLKMPDVDYSELVKLDPHVKALLN